MPESTGADFLRKIYPTLSTSPEVKDAAKSLRTGDAKDPIQTYLDALGGMVDRRGPERREHRMEILKDILYTQFITTPDNIPASYPSPDTVIAAQKDSLDTWIDYLTSDDAKYPDWLKYWTVRSVVGIGRYDKQRHAFVERNFKEGKSKTVSPFPDLNREALGLVVDAMQKKYAATDPSHYQGEGIKFRNDISVDDRQTFLSLLRQPKENFAKLYGWAVEHIVMVPEELQRITDGRWKTYEQGSDPKALVHDLLEGEYSSGWCIAGESYARQYLQTNNLYIYYSQNTDGEANIPRVVIVQNKDTGHITEVRGIADIHENLDSYITDVVMEELKKDYPNETDPQQKLKNVQMLMTVERKVKNNQPLTKDDLKFLYEIDRKIETLGYGDDPRIKELRDSRKPFLREDAAIVLAPEGRGRLASDEIAWSEREIVVGKTQAYIGPLFPSIFTMLSKDVSIYTSFPEDKIHRETITIGGKTKVQLERELDERGFKVSDYAKGMMRNKAFTTLFYQEDITFVRLKVKDFGFPPNDYPTTRELYAKAKEFGLEEPPVEAAIHKRLQYADQPMNELLYLGMIPIMDPDGDPRVFLLIRFDDELWLFGSWADPTHEWNPDHEVLFSLRK